jgi:hypothetical protein
MQLTLGTFKGLRYAGALLLLTIGVALGVTYWNSVAQHRRYLTSRNFRLLTVLATQTQSVIDGQGRIFSGLLADANNFAASSRDEKGNGTPAWLRSPLRFIPSLQHIDLSDMRPILEPVKGTSAKQRIETHRGRPWFLFGMYSAQGSEVLKVRLSAAGILEPIFAPKLQQGAFDTLVFATQDGQVVFATGRRQHELQWTRLDTLFRRVKKQADPPFTNLARTTSIDDVVIAGVDYKMFIQPCCRQTMPAADGGAPGGMMVAGLVEANRLDSASRAISPTLVLIGMAAVLLAVVSWPFLKLALLGDRQRISVMDVVQLGACSVLGLALATIIVLTTWAYSRVNHDVDDQLELLARALDDNLQQELRQAYDQLACMEQGLVGWKRGVYREILEGGALRCGDSRGAAAWPYPLFETFALLRNDGYQEIKASRESWATSIISVKRRRYFDAVKKQQYWAGVDFCPGGCLVESLWSWNTGIQQAVLAKPTGLPHLPVASLSIPLRSVIGAVVPPGFEYAVIDISGEVQFHSDAQRNVHENIFQETDGNRRLRAMAAARSAGSLSLDYWGRQYRAYVRPSGVPGWSIVTMFDKQGTRGLNLESAAVSVLFLAVYMALWLGVMILALRMGATWLWPDPLRRRHYRALAIAHLVLLAAFAAIACTRDAKSILIAGFCIPVFGWLISVAVLNRPPSRAAELIRRPDPLAEYALMGSVLLILSGVVPGIAFVVRAHELQVESYVKHRQLRLAHALNSRMGALVQKFSEPERAETREAFVARARVGEFEDVDLYYDFFYGTRVEPTGAVAAKDSHGGTHSDGDLVLSILEEYMPYYTEFSVEMRELLHERAADGSWASVRMPSRELELTIPKYSPDKALTVRSTLPSWRPAPSREDAPARGETRAAQITLVAVAPMIGIGFAGLAYAIVAFALRRVFLSQVAEPLWASGRLAATSGDNLFVLCDPAVMEAQIRGASPLNLGPIVRSDTPEAEWRRALIHIDRGDGDRAILIPDLDAELDNVEAMQRKFALLEELVDNPTRTVVVLSQTPLPVLNDSIPREPGSSGADRARFERIHKAFVVLDWRDVPNDAPPVDVLIEDPLPPGWRTWAKRLSPARWRPADRLRTSEALLAREGRPNLFLRRICDDIRRSQPYRSDWLSREQVFDEIEERASGYYRRVWNACSDDEKIVLTHIAQQGLANAASRRVVRRLLVRGLLFKDPGLRLMNDTFTRFVSSALCRTEAVRLEGEAEPSTWDRLRMPLAVAAASAGVFLYATQREMFDATLTVLGGVTAAVPVMFRMVSMIGDRRPARAEESRA